MPYVATQPFGEHVRGSALTDEEGDEAIEVGQGALLVRVAAPEPEPEAAEPEAEAHEPAAA